MKYLLSLFILILYATEVSAVNLKCTHIVPVSSQRNVLYKDSNLHGNRGRTFLDQAHQLQGASTIWIAGSNKVIVSCFGLFACDLPYGCRYYQTICGDHVSNDALVKLVYQNGGKYIALVGNNVNGLCFSFDPREARVGFIAAED